MSRARRPVDVATRATASFIQRHVKPGARLLEVGAGGGALALHLLEQGHAVTGIDPDPEEVAAAQALGAPVRLGTWPSKSFSDLDAIVFTRSLHHVHGLEDAVRAAHEALADGGLLLVEDFAYEQADARVAAWLCDQAAAVAGRGVLPAATDLPPDELLVKLLTSDDPLSAWRADHDHDLHAFDAMQDAVRDTFGRSAVETAPYLYRYFIPLLPPSRAGADLVEGVLRRESEAAERGELALIGRRIIAQTVVNRAAH